MKTNVNRWKEVYDWNKANSNYLEVPDEEVVRIVNKIFIPNGVRRVLDVGCGAGRHTMYMSSKGLEVDAMDSSGTALEIVNKVADEKGYKVTTRLGECTAIPCDDDSFDAVVCWGVIHYLSTEERKKCLDEIRRVLVPGGPFALTLRSVEDSEAASASKDDRLSESGAEESKGMYFKYYSAREIIDELKEFKDVKYGHHTFSEVGKMDRRIAHWLIVAWNGGR